MRLSGVKLLESVMGVRRTHPFILHEMTGYQAGMDAGLSRNRRLEP